MLKEFSQVSQLIHVAHRLLLPKGQMQSPKAPITESGDTGFALIQHQLRPVSPSATQRCLHTNEIL